MKFGIVDQQGRIRFKGCIDDCREFLRGQGLECGDRGWEGNGMIGAIQFWKGEYHAVAFKEQV